VGGVDTLRDVGDCEPIATFTPAVAPSKPFSRRVVADVEDPLAHDRGMST